MEYYDAMTDGRMKPMPVTPTQLTGQTKKSALEI